MFGPQVGVIVIGENITKDIAKTIASEYEAKGYATNWAEVFAYDEDGSGENIVTIHDPVDPMKAKVLQASRGWEFKENILKLKRGSNNARKGGSHSGPCGWKARRDRSYDAKNSRKTNRMSQMLVLRNNKK